MVLDKISNTQHDNIFIVQFKIFNSVYVDREPDIAFNVDVKEELFFIVWETGFGQIQYEKSGSNVGALTNGGLDDKIPSSKSHFHRKTRDVIQGSNLCDGRLPNLIS